MDVRPSLWMAPAGFAAGKPQSSPTQQDKSGFFELLGNSPNTSFDEIMPGMTDYLRYSIDHGYQAAAKAYGLQPTRPGMSAAEAATFKNPLAAMHLMPVDDVEQVYTGVVGEMHSLVSEKMETAFKASQNSLKSAMKILTSAVNDVKWAIDGIISDMAGRELTDTLLGHISELKDMQSRIFAKINELAELNMSEDELRAMTETEKSQKPDNRGAKLDQALAEKQTGQKVPLKTNEAQLQAFEHELDPGKKDALLNSAAKKLTPKLESLLSEAQALLSAAAADHENSADLIQDALKALDKVAGLAELCGGFEGADSDNIRQLQHKANGLQAFADELSTPERSLPESGSKGHQQAFAEFLEFFFPEN